MGDLISIIVPVYNVEMYLTACVESLLMQTYKNLEIILVDDGSSDNSGKICDELQLKDKRIKVVHRKNSGVSATRNYGIKISTGKYITFVDSDDYVDIDYLKVLYSNAVKFNADLSICGFVKTTKKNNMLDRNNNQYFIESKDMLNHIFDNGFFQGYIWCKLYKKDIISNIKFDSKVKVCEDLLFVIDYLNNSCSVVYTYDQLYFYRQRKSSALNNVDDAKLTIFIALNKLYDTYCKDIKFKNFYFYFYAKYHKFVSINSIRYKFNNIYNDKEIFLKNKTIYFLYNIFPKSVINFLILVKQRIKGFYD